ncbi:hypothetical protein LCGC14_2486460 [marine sediment metagenome]|uniref:Uncharacterized protein n=1 Tax=marine sediment metagenome TaxID=412755 RepID=A0A0F9DZS0_9ZZZZ
MAKTKDKFSQIAFMTVNESAANTLTFNGMTVFSNILTPKAILIHRISYIILDDQIDKILADADVLTFGLSGDDQMANVLFSDARVYDMHSVGFHDAGTTAVDWLFWESPKIFDFNALPGGGKLVPADRIFMFVKGASLATAVSMSARFDFTLVDLSATEYIELAQALRVLT